jgi:hypothetical protein
MRAVELLQGARDLIAQGWAQGADARAEDGTPVEPWDPAATSWSLLGGIVASLERSRERAGDLPLERLALALHYLALVVENDSLAAWNDDAAQTKDAVVDVLDRAIAACASEAPRLFSDN